MRYIRKRDPMDKYYCRSETREGIQLCPICGEPVKMPHGIVRSPIDHDLYHIDCILDEYWKMKGYGE